MSREHALTAWLSLCCAPSMRECRPERQRRTGRHRPPARPCCGSIAAIRPRRISSTVRVHPIWRPCLRSRSSKRTRPALSRNSRSETSEAPSGRSSLARKRRAKRQRRACVWAAGYFADEAYSSARRASRRWPRLSRQADEVKPGGLITAGAVRTDPFRADQARPMGMGGEPVCRHARARRSQDRHDAAQQLGRARRQQPRHARRQGRRAHRGPVRRVDLGATLGKTGGVWKHSKNDVKDYVASDFVDGVEEGIVRFHYKVRPKGLGMFAILYPPHSGRVNDHRETMKGIKAENARWIGARPGAPQRSAVPGCLRRGRL